MPRWLRKFTFHQIAEFHEQQNESANTGDTKTVIDADGKIKSPEVLQEMHNRKSTYK